MPYSVHWDNPEQTTLHLRLSGTLTIEDYYLGLREVYDRIQTKPHTVDIIFDRAAVRRHPSKVFPVLRYAADTMPRNLGKKIIVGGTSFTRLAFNVIGQLKPNLGHELYFVDSLSDAYILLGDRSVAAV